MSPCNFEIRQLTEESYAKEVVHEITCGLAMQRDFRMPIIFYQRVPLPFSRISIQRLQCVSPRLDRTDLFYVGQWIGVTQDLRVVVAESREEVEEHIKYLEYIKRYKIRVDCRESFEDIMRRFS